MKEMRDKGEYLHHKVIRAAQGIKISAQDLEKAIPGTQVLVYHDGVDDIEDLKDQVMSDLNSTLKKVSNDGKGVCVQASTLGSLEALLEFLSDSKIPVSGINIGPIHKKDVTRASVSLESNPEYAIILAFDVQTTKEAADEADKLKVQIFSADIIYHLFDKLTAYMKKLSEEKKKEQLGKAVFPCVLKISDCFRKSNPIVLGVDILEGKLKIGTPLCVFVKGENENEKKVIELGSVQSIQHNKISQNEGKPGTSVAIQIQSKDNKIMFGKQFDEKSGEVYSRITRESIDILKEYFADEIKTEEKQLI